jgi:tetratricopeptide (TPR) repeat protein
VRFFLVILLGAAAFCMAAAQPSPLTQARQALANGEADRALSLLDATLGQGGPQNALAEAHNLKCRVLLIKEKWDAAGGECEQAVKLIGQNSDYHLWLARALGERASRAAFLSAYGLGKRSRTEFETAVKLDGRNAAALADLGEFYYSAPSVVGGGMDKAEAVVRQLDGVDPVRAHELLGHMAEEKKDLAGAEREFKQALSTASQPAFQWMTLASFYRRHERWQEMETAIHNGQTAAGHDRRAAVALFNGASILRKTRRDPGLEQKLLESYLASPQKTEEAPAFVAHLWLAELKALAGDGAGAERERQASLSLARDYKPAQEFKAQGGRH